MANEKGQLLTTSSAKPNDNLIEEIYIKWDYINKILKKEITINDVPKEWQEEIKHLITLGNKI